MNVLRRILLMSFSAAMLVIVVAPQGANAHSTKYNQVFSAVYVFGDSLSDPGNAWALRRKKASPPYAPIPEFPYDSHRFSNGKTWAEVMTHELRLNRGGKPAWRNSKNGNYAFAGARAQGSNDEKPSFGDQVARYLATTGGVADPDALYVVQFGGNDVRDALESALVGGDPYAVIGGAMRALGQNIAMLRNAGAQNFLVANAPNLGKTPVIIALGAETPAELLSSGFNIALDAMLANFAAGGLQVYRLDLFNFVDVATDMPHGFGFAYAGTPCVQVFTAPASEICNDPDQYLFWDGIHPTRAAHRLVGNIAVNQLSLR